MCARDRDGSTRHCATCRRLAVTDDPPDAVISAFAAASKGKPPSVKTCRLARDGAHLIAELDLGSRKRVLTVRHGEGVAEIVMGHSLLGGKRLS